MGSQVDVAVIAPSRLSNAFVVLLTSTTNIRPLASAPCVEILRSILRDKIPDVLLLYLDGGVSSRKKDQVSGEQVHQSKACWPDAYCIVIIKEPQIREEVQALGADIVFHEAIAPARLLKTIDAIDSDETGTLLADAGTAKSTYTGKTLADQLRKIERRYRWWQVWKRGARAKT